MEDQGLRTERQDEKGGPSVKCVPFFWLVLLPWLFFPLQGFAKEDFPANSAAERKVLGYLRTHLQPGEPVVISKLYNDVFTTPEERRALDRLYDTVFKIPLFVAQYYVAAGKPPSIRAIAEQFHLTLEGEAEILLRILEYDRRIPRFLSRDPHSGEITSVDVDKIKADARFGKAIERSLAGWEGKPAHGFVVQLIGGGQLDLADYRGKICLLYFWFTHCPPCVQITPHLVSLQKEFRARGFSVIGLNADNLLELGYDDPERLAYIQKQGINFPVAHLSAGVQAAYGGVSLFPSLFLIDRGGIIRNHFVHYQEKSVLEKAIEPLLR
jgi:thiol-disulfide isomerase/thioredoxin